MKQIKLSLILFLNCLCFINAQNDYPVITQIVTDNAHLFSKSETRQLEAKLTDYEVSTSHQIVVLTINNLGNDTVENYAVQTFNMDDNRLGQEKADNGILILVAKNDRKFRIEVGDGLTPIITDLITSRINRNHITPAFKEGAYFKGIDDATSEIIKIIEDPIYANEFVSESDSTPAEVSFIAKFFSSLFLTSFFFIMGLLGYNKFIAKRKSEKTSVKELYKSQKTKFIIVTLLAVCFVIYFNTFFWYIFIGLFILAFLSTFVGIGFFVILKEAFKRAIAIFTALFTGKLGLIIFPFYLPSMLLFFIAGFIFCFIPILMGAMFVITVVFDNDINDLMSGLSPLHFLYLAIGIVLLYFIITAGVALKNVRNSLKESFGFSFFKIDKILTRSIVGRTSRGYSSSGSSSYSSSRSSSSSSFSGGGGSSSGGGASGSW